MTYVETPGSIASLNIGLTQAGFGGSDPGGNARRRFIHQLMIGRATQLRIARLSQTLREAFLRRCAIQTPGPISFALNMAGTTMLLKEVVDRLEL